MDPNPSPPPGQPEAAATIADVARAADCSLATVSRVFNDAPAVRSATRLRVLAAAERLGYRRDPVFAALGRRRRDRAEPVTTPVAVVASRYFAGMRLAPGAHRDRLVDGILAGLARLRYDVAGPFALARQDPEAVHDLLHGVVASGIIASELPHDCLEAVAAERGPVVCCGGLYRHGFHRADSDCHQGMQLVFAQLLERGYRRIGMVMHPRTDSASGGMWFAAYLHQQHLARQTHGCEVLPLCEQVAPSTVAAWLREYQPDCVIARRSQRELIESLAQRIPDDLGYVNLGVRERGHRTSGLVSNAFGVGLAAADLLETALCYRDRGLVGLSRTILVPYEWNEGASLRPG